MTGIAGIDLTPANTKLSQYLAAEEAVLLGQEYTINGRRLVRADLAAIRLGIEYWNNWVKRLNARSAGRSAAIVPRPGF